LKHLLFKIVTTVAVAIFFGLSAQEAQAQTALTWDDFTYYEMAPTYRCGYYAPPIACYWSNPTSPYDRRDPSPCPIPTPTYSCGYPMLITSAGVHNGRVKLPDGDLIEIEIRDNAVSSDIVEFVLQSGSGITWWKGLNVPDGGGSSWDIYTQDSRTQDSVALWAGQVNNGQVLTFSKAKIFGIHFPVYTLGGLNRIKPGSRVIIRWMKDNL